MARLEKRNGRFRVSFRYGKKYHHELETEEEGEASAQVGRAEENLILMGRGKLDPPTDGNLALFLLSDGKINEKPKVPESISLGHFCRRYRDEFTKGTRESYTHYTAKIHTAPLEHLIGSRTGNRIIGRLMMGR